MSTAKLLYPGLELVVEDSTIPFIRSGENRLEVSANLVKTDAALGVLREKIASILMYPPLNEEELEGELARLAAEYRAKSVLYTFYELAKAAGALADRLEVDPLYPLARKAEEAGGYLALLYTRMKGGEEERVRRIYEELLQSLGLIEDGRVALKALDDTESRYKRLLIEPKTFYSGLRVTDALASKLLETIKALPRVEGRYTGRHVKAEGTPFHLKCLEPRELASEHLECSGGEPVCRGGHVISSSVVCSCGGRRLVVKDYSRMGGKWVVFKIMSKPMVDYRVMPRARMAYEYIYMERLREIENIVTPRFLELCSTPLTRSMAVREYLEGRILRESTEPGDWSHAGAALGRIHDAGATLGDANPGNFLLTSRHRMGILDAEQARDYTTRNAAWDIITFTSTSLFWRTSEEQVKAFLEGYKETSPEPRRVFEEASKAYAWIGILPTVPHIYMQSKKILEDIVKSS